MKLVFADTSYYLALVNPLDQHHAWAVEIADTFIDPIILTDFIVVELGNALARGKGRNLFTDLLQALKADVQVTIVPASTMLVDEGLELFSRRPDKDWSLTDCISFSVMSESEIQDVLTTDHHFEQAGFRRLGF